MYEWAPNSKQVLSPALVLQKLNQVELCSVGRTSSQGAGLQRRISRNKVRKVFDARMISIKLLILFVTRRYTELCICKGLYIQWHHSRYPRNESSEIMLMMKWTLNLKQMNGRFAGHVAPVT